MDEIGTKRSRHNRLKLIRNIDPGDRPKLVNKPKPRKSKPKQSKPITGTIRRNANVRDPIPAETIERIYEGQTAVLFATGPSLTDDVVQMVMDAHSTRELYLFGCNDSFRMLPFLHVHYACDTAWWRIHWPDIKDYRAEKWTQEPRMSKSEYPGLRRIAGAAGAGLSRKQNLIHYGSNSGYQLLNLAYLYGIKKFILCGYNMCVVNRQRHFFGDHPQGLNRSGNYTGFAANFNPIKPAELGIQIINATPHSALTAFPKMTLEKALL